MTGESQSEIPQIPSPDDVLKTKVPFPFEGMNVWAEAFNHMRFKKGEKPKEGPKIERKDAGNFILTLPENPTLGQILDITKRFIDKAKIKLNNPRLLIFTRDLRNQARLLAQLTTQSSLSSLPENEQKEIASLIVSLYHLGEGLEKAVKGEEYCHLPEVSLQSLLNSSYELPKRADLQSYKDELFLRLLGKDQAFFDEKSLKDPKLSQVPEHSAYYYLLRRYLLRRYRTTQQQEKPFNLQMEEFDQWLLKRKNLLVSWLGSYFIDPRRPPLQKGGRTYTALWQTIFFSFFSYLDQAVEEEGWKKAKEHLASPPLFTDLGEDLQKMLRDKDIFPEDAEKLSFNTSRFIFEDTARLIEKVKKQSGETEYGKMTLFDLARKLLEEKKRKNPGLSVFDQMSLLLDLVQAYEFEKTLKLTTAVEKKAFECNLRSYILGRLYESLLPNEVEVYTVLQPKHTKLLVFDKTNNKAYWIDPTVCRFYYTKDREGKITGRVKYFSNLSIIEAAEEEWQKISKQRQADPDNFSVFGQFNKNFSVISPFKPGIKAGFLNNLRSINYNNGLRESDPLKKQEFFKKAYYCALKALKFNPNVPDFHNNLAVLYTKREFAEALNIPYKESLLQAFNHYQKAIEINPNDPDFHNNLAVLYTKREFAKDENEYFANLNLAFLERKRAFDLDKTPDRFDRFFWLVRQIADKDAEQFLLHLSEEAKEAILYMYHNKQMKEEYEKIPPAERLSLWFDKTLFWKIFSEKFLKKQEG